MTYPEKFRFWVQTALPLVFDDSLSYYELLAKVVNYINDIIKDIKAVNEKIDALDIETVVETVDNMQEIIDKLPVDEVEGLVDDVDNLKNSVNTLNEEYATLQATLAEKANTEDVNTALAEKAPIRHSSSDNNYGVGNDTLYGHLKLSDSIESDNSVGSGVAATPLSVNTVNNKVKTYSKRNLLDNAYFVGGGSQLGDGVFPVNQRGQTSYPNAGYTIDRWYNDTGGDVILRTNGLGVNGSDNNLRQRVAANTIGQQVTASFLLSDNSLYTGSAIVPAAPSTGTNYFLSFGPSNIGVVLGVSQDGVDFFLQRRTTTEIVIKAVKLEFGSYQTLAHQENSVWVLNELPDYGEELAKCMRYYQKFRTQAIRPTYGADFRPPMATETPTPGETTIGNITYYTASSEA